MVRHTVLPALIVWALLAGCTPSGEEDTSGTSGADPAPRSEAASPAAPTEAAAGAPALTEDEAQQLLQTYNRKNNRANARLNSKLLKTIETESAFALDNAVYRIGRKLDPDNQDPIQPYQWVDPEFHIPTIPEGTAPWFVAEASTDSSPDERDVLLFTSEGDGALWKIALYARLDEPLPELATDADGNAVVVDPTEAGGSPTAAADVAAAHATYLTSGDDVPEAAGLETHDRSQEIVDEKYDGTDLRQEFSGVDSFERKVTLADHPVRALQTAGGGAVAFYVTRQRLSVRAPDRVFNVEGHLAALGSKDLIATPDGRQAFLVGMDITWLDAWVTAIPGQEDGELSVLGNQVGMVKVTGAPRSEYPEDLPPEVESLLPEQA